MENKQNDTSKALTLYSLNKYTKERFSALESTILSLKKQNEELKQEIEILKRVLAR